MKFWEAMKALSEGEKVRAKDWTEGSYIDELSRLENYHERINLVYWMNYEWEIYKEPEDKKLYQWRHIYRGMWIVDDILRTKDQAKKVFSEYENYKIHAGPFE